MITTVGIEHLRGIREGCLQGLGPLTVLAGQNGCGKSTVLDALLLVAHEAPGEAVGQVGVRRRGTPWPARWVFWKGGHAGPAVVRGRADDGVERSLRLEWSPAYRQPEEEPEQRRQHDHYGAIRWWLPAEDGKEHSATLFYPQGYVSQDAGPVEGAIAPAVRLLDGGLDTPSGPLHALLSRADELGTLDAVRDLLVAAVPDLLEPAIRAEADKPLLYLRFPHGALPVAMAGDGTRWVTSLCFELAVGREGLVLLEEPEVHLHPGYMVLTARAIVAAVQAGVQVVLSTHSLEFLDALLGELGEDGAERLCVQRLALSNGVLSVTRIAGPDVRFERIRLEDDLR